MAWVGMDALFAAIDRVAVEAGTVARSVATIGSAMVVREAQSNFVGSHAKGKPHVGGAQPNVVTGTARRSIISTPVARLGPFEYATKVGPTVIYGRSLDLGDPTRSQRPYPFFTPAVATVQPKLTGLAEAQWAKFLH